MSINKEYRHRFPYFWRIMAKSEGCAPVEIRRFNRPFHSQEWDFWTKDMDRSFWSIWSEHYTNEINLISPRPIP